MSDQATRPIDPWLEQLWEQGGTDLLLSGGSAPRIRVDGQLRPLPGAAELTGAEIHEIAAGHSAEANGTSRVLGIDADDAVRHLLGGQALKLPDNTNDGNIDFRKDIHRRPDNDDGSEYQDQQGHHDEGVWPLKGQANYPHLLVLLE